jgi:hypothetical protein
MKWWNRSLDLFVRMVGAPQARGGAAGAKPPGSLNDDAAAGAKHRQNRLELGSQVLLVQP